jgi:3-oxoacyl-[acyl-carrier protein] reductase
MNNLVASESGKVAVITGATRGLGRALSLEFAAAGYEVIGLYRKDTTSASDLEDIFKKSGYRGLFLQQDISCDEGWSRFEEAMKLRLGKQVTLIANASATFSPKPFHLTDWQEFSDQLNVCVKGTVSILKRVIPHMVKSRRGTVVAILSSALIQQPKGFSAYLTAKSALAGLLSAASAEYRSRGVRFFAVSPAFMQTSMSDGWSEHFKAAASNLGETVLPTEVAARVFDLAESELLQGTGEEYSLNELLSNSKLIFTSSSD